MTQNTISDHRPPHPEVFMKFVKEENGWRYIYPQPEVLTHYLYFGGKFTDIVDVELKNITWHGSIEDINGKIHIDGKKQEEKE